MKTAFFADLITLRQSALQTVVVILFVSIFVGVGMNNAVAIVPIAVATSIVSLPFTLPALDEQNGWQAFRAALPLTRGDVIFGRALAVMAATLLTVAFSVVLTLAFLLVARAFPSLGFSTAGITPGIVAFAAAAAFALCSVLVAILTPLVAKFGLTKAIRYIPLAFLVVFFAAMWALGSTDALAVLESAFENVVMGNPWPTAGIVFVVGLALYALGNLLAAKLYATREF